MELDNVKKFLELKDKRTDIEEKLKANKKESAVIEEEIIEEFIENGVTSIKCDGRLVYSAKMQAASIDPEMKEKAREIILADPNLSNVVTVNSASFSAAVKERGSVEDFIEEFPELDGMVKIFETIKIRSKKG